MLFRDVSISSGDIVVDIGCNDGTLLKSYEQLDADLSLIGFDPAVNFVGWKNESFLRINDYFNKIHPTDMILEGLVI